MAARTGHSTQESTETPAAIITGAGSGIGRATAACFARHGWRIALVGRRAEALRQTASLLQPSDRNRAVEIPADLADPSAAARITRQAFDSFGRIDAIVNNAAAFELGSIFELDDHAFRRSFEVNAIAPTRLVRHAWPMLSRQTPRFGAMRARVINISSMAAVDPFPGLGAYGMSKRALEGLTLAINNEGRDAGILAFSLVLGAVETEMLRKVAPESILPRDQALAPEQVAEVIVQCAAGERDGDASAPLRLVAT